LPGFRPGSAPRLQTGASRVQLALQNLAAGNLGRQGLPINRILDIRRFPLRHQRRDIVNQSFPQRQHYARMVPCLAVDPNCL
jgi:hypothetical protein